MLEGSIHTEESKILLDDKKSNQNMDKSSAQNTEWQANATTNS